MVCLLWLGLALLLSALVGALGVVSIGPLGPRTAISALLGLGRPTAIRRLVIAIVVIAFDAVTLARLWTHIFEEVVEAHPPFTNGDASTAVPRIAFVRRIEAPGLHVSPSIML
jgi:hypothetical protein